MTYAIIILTVILSFVCFNNGGVMEKLAFTPYKVVRENQWYRLLTHGFVHADMGHLLVNMFTFWSFGLYMEHVFSYLGWGWLGLGRCRGCPR